MGGDNDGDDDKHIKPGWESSTGRLTTTMPTTEQQGRMDAPLRSASASCVAGNGVNEPKREIFRINWSDRCAPFVGLEAGEVAKPSAFCSVMSISPYAESAFFEWNNRRV